MRFSPKRIARLIVRGLEHAKEEGIRLRGMKPGQIVVDEAWVGRNKYKQQRWPRAKGGMNVRKRPFVCFSAALRTAEMVSERVAIKKRRKLESMVRRPKDTKPIYNPRPYYTW